MAEENKNQIAKFDQQLSMAKSVKDLFEITDVKQRAIKGYEATTGRKDGENRFQQERFAYLEIINQKPELKGAPMWTHFKVINKVMHSGLSLRDNKLYLQSISKDNKIVDIKVDPSPAGRREMMELMPNVKKAPEAQVVMEGDEFVYDKLNQKIIKHISTEKSKKDLKLENIVFSYQRIVWSDGSITDVVVPHDDLVSAKKKSKIKSVDAGLWVEFPGEACKKTATNRAFRLYHKYPDNAVMLDSADDETQTSIDTYHEDVTDPAGYEPEVNSEASAEQVDENTGEVTQAEEATKMNENKPEKKEKKQYNLLD